MRTLLIVLMLLFVSGCRSGRIRPDVCDGTNPNGCPYAAQANYQTVEFSACGYSWNGLGTCFVEKGKSLDSIELSIQGYHKGAIRVTSKTCEVIDEDVRYENSQRVRIGLYGEAKESCVIGFALMPEYDDEETSAVVIRSLKGFLWVSVTEQGDETFGAVSKVAEGGDAVLRVPVAADGDYRVAFRGCGTAFDKTITASGGLVEVRVRDLIPTLGIQRCYFAGGVERGGAVKYVSWLVSGYDKRFIPLPIPVVKFDGEKINVSADKNVSVIALDGSFKLDTSAEFKFKRQEAHVLRALTVAGRVAVGYWLPKEQRFVWKN